MSQEFESIVRPFQDNRITPAQTYYKPGQIGVPNVTLRIGRGGGSGKVITGSYSYNQTYYMINAETERKELFKTDSMLYRQYAGKFGQGTIGDPTKPGG